ncbi:aminoglycoside phosphotransferase family protein [Streptomyces apocyni]|uniref:aminoglycoside phosphotransferase family protein n=1 Tax=Streptomyces apocyni TaxID=2654677 RepID=UPI0012EA2E9C|nr:aminoglycoside phosphotransferase family protein [Streptomyces apocyni]
MAFEPPQRLVQALGESPDDAERDGTAGWLEKLPQTAQEAVSRRELTVERVQAPGGRSSLVVLVRRPDGTPAVLKLAPPAAQPGLEAAALAHWDGWGACQLLEHGEDGALLLERLHADVSLRSLPEAKALLEATGTVRRLWVAPPASHAFETVEVRTARRATALESADDSVRPLADAALAARSALVADASEAFLLHGAFRQGKVLAGDRAPWLTVGPDPVVGERAYDLAPLVLDRLDDLVAASSGAATARRRVAKLADSLEVDRERLRGWTLFRATETAVRALRTNHPRQAEPLLELASWL